jgi:hypothetical protein
MSQIGVPIVDRNTESEMKRPRGRAQAATPVRGNGDTRVFGAEK